MYAGSVVTLSIQEAICGYFSYLISTLCGGAALNILIGIHFPAGMRLVLPSLLCFLLFLAV